MTAAFTISEAHEFTGAAIEGTPCPAMRAEITRCVDRLLGYRVRVVIERLEPEESN